MFFDVFQTLCKNNGITCTKAAIDIGLSNSITTKWKKTGATPNSETLQKIAAYFDMPVASLLEIGMQQPSIDVKTESRDIAQDIKSIMTKLVDGDCLLYDDVPMTDESRECLLSAITLGLKAANLRSKR